MENNSWHDQAPNTTEFKLALAPIRRSMGADSELRAKSLDLQLDGRQYLLGYHSEWLGVPVIRLAEDLVRQQELIFREKPDLVIEIGVARGGGLVFSASMQDISAIAPNVVGVDNKIFLHTKEAIEHSKYSSGIQLIEADSTSEQAVQSVRKAITETNVKTCLLILDSDHTSAHVLAELYAYVPLLPKGSTVMVCDTIIDEFPPGTYMDRSWADGSGPSKAIDEYLLTDKSLVRMEHYTEDLLLTEMRGGILRKVSA